jgi:dihydrodipicolinate synthase/N-acetylneuraminate lyase
MTDHGSSPRGPLSAASAPPPGLVPQWVYGRKITGMSAILLPLRSTGEIDWRGFDAHVQRTVAAGLIPAVNMDTGFAHLLDDATRQEVLRRTAEQTHGGWPRFVAGAFVPDQPGAAWQPDAYARAIDQVVQAGGTPVIFQSHGLVELADAERLAAYELLGRHCDGMFGFELSSVFAPFGRIYSLDFYRQWIQLPKLRGAKHSSLHRQPEWDRLAIRDSVRPDFQVLTGNDLAIDMVFFGSDYLLGLSTFAPDAFAQRDAWWEAGDLRALEVNDWLQYLGFFAFRPPVPAYKHSAAQFLKIRGWLECDDTFPGSPPRDVADVEVLRQIWDGLERSLGQAASC